jgi:pimeloyl-ACP methyl ester carboxylesterase
MFWRQSGKRMDNLISNPTLAIFGTQDMFTSSHKLDAWCNKMYGLSLQAVSSEKSSGFRWKMIEGAGHFWREHGAEAQLTESLRDWVQEEVIDGLSE